MVEWVQFRVETCPGRRSHSYVDSDHDKEAQACAETAMGGLRRRQSCSCADFLVVQFVAWKVYSGMNSCIMTLSFKYFVGERSECDWKVPTAFGHMPAAW